MGFLSGLFHSRDKPINSTGGKGEVVALYPLMVNRMSVDRDNKGHLYYQYQMQASGTSYQLPSGINSGTVDHISTVRLV